jgi:hypothetical protein
VIEDDAKAVDVRTRWNVSVPAGPVIVIVKSAVAEVTWPNDAPPAVFLRKSIVHWMKP